MPSIASSYGGPTQSLRGYLAASHAVGIESEVAAPECGAHDAREMEAAVGAGALHLFPTMFTLSAVISPALWSWLRRTVRQFDVVHVHGLLNPVSSLAARIALRTGRPLVIRPFGTMSRYTVAHRRSWAKKLYLRALDIPNLRRVSALHFTSQGEQDEAAWHPVPVRELGHVVPPPYVGPRGTTPRYVADAPVALFVGRLHPIKNLEALIDAWHEVVRHLPAALLVIAGDGPPSYRDALAERARTRGLGDRVRFEGFVGVHDKTRLFAEAALFVLPSHHENFGVAALEAVAHGLPVVASTEVQIATELAREGLGIATAGRPAELAAALLALLRDREMRERCAADGPLFVEANFSPAFIGDKLHRMYRSALEHHAQYGSA